MHRHCPDPILGISAEKEMETNPWAYHPPHPTFHPHPIKYVALLHRGLSQTPHLNPNPAMTHSHVAKNRAVPVHKTHPPKVTNTYAPPLPGPYFGRFRDRPSGLDPGQVAK